MEAGRTEADGREADGMAASRGGVGELREQTICCLSVVSLSQFYCLKPLVQSASAVCKLLCRVQVPCAKYIAVCKGLRAI